MRKLENIKKRVCKEYKYYPWIFLKPLVWVPIAASVLSFWMKGDNWFFDFLSKGFVGFAISQIVLEFSGHKDTIKLLRKLSEIHLILEKWKIRIDEGKTITKNDIDYPINSIVIIQGEYYDEYDILNVDKEKNYISEMKGKIGNETEQIEKENLLINLNDYIKTLELQGLTDIREITGTTNVYFSNILPQKFTNEVSKSNPIYEPNKKYKKSR